MNIRAFSSVISYGFTCNTSMSRKRLSSPARLFFSAIPLPESLLFFSHTSVMTPGSSTIFERLSSIKNTDPKKVFQSRCSATDGDFDKLKSHRISVKETLRRKAINEGNRRDDK